MLVDFKSRILNAMSMRKLSNKENKLKLITISNKGQNQIFKNKIKKKNLYVSVLKIKKKRKRKIKEKMI